MDRIPGSLRLLPLLISLGLAACGGGGGGGGGGGTGGADAGGTQNPQVDVPPTVSSTTPAKGAVGALSTGAINVTFSEAVKASVDPASTEPTEINNSTFIVTAVIDGKTVNVPGQLSYARQTATFTPDASLVAAGTQFTVTVKGTVQDTTGNALGDDYEFSFTTPSVSGKAVARDASGNLYLVGTTNSTLAGKTTNAGGKDLFVTKIGADGVVAWTSSIGTAADEDAAGVAVDASGNVYVSGTTKGSLAGVTNSGGDDVVVAAFDTNGTALWTKQLNAVNNQTATGVVVGADGVYITGYTDSELNGEAAYNGDTATGAYAGGATDAFLVKLDSVNGTSQWVRELGSAGDDRSQAVAFDAGRNLVYVAGTTNSQIPGVPTGEGARGMEDLFFAKYDTNGTQVSVHQRGTGENDIATGIAVDASGNVYVAGHTNCQLDGNFNTAGVGNTYEVFLVKYDVNDAYQWTKEYGSTATENVTGVAVDSTGIYVSGITYGSLPDASGNVVATNAGLSDLFVMKFDPDPSSASETSSDFPEWAVQKGTAADDLAGGIVLDGSGTSFVIGALTNPALTLPGARLAGDGVFYTSFTQDGAPL